MKLGIPQAMTYYWFYPKWKIFLESLGFEVTTSEKTNRKIVLEGCKNVVDETCLPVKTFMGHCIELEDKVDALFIPSVKSIELKRYFCPKIIALPETVAVNTKKSILTLVIDNHSNAKNAYFAYQTFAKRLGFSSIKIEKAYRRAVKVQNIYEKLLLEGFFPDEAMKLIKIKKDNSYKELKKENLKYNIVVLGNPYLVYDSYLNFNLKEKLLKMGCKMITAEILHKKEIPTNTSFLKKDLFWTYPRKLIGAASYFGKSDFIDGVILLTSFGCGSDAIISPFISKLSQEKPFMEIAIDEHTGEAGFITRLEAFVDMLELKITKRSFVNESSLSTYG